MSSLKSQSALKHPQPHTVLPSPFAGLEYCISRKEIEVHGSGSLWLFPVILAQLSGLPRFLAPSAVSLGSPVLNPNLHGTFSWPTSRSPFTPFLPAVSLLHSSKLLRESSASLLHLAFQLPKLPGKGRPKAMWFSLSPKLPGSHPSPKLHGFPSRGCHNWV